VSTIPINIDSFAAAAERAMAGNRMDEAVALWQQILRANPDHVPSLLQLGLHALHGGNAKAARELFERVVRLDGRDAQQWVNLAVTCHRLGDSDAEAEAITNALKADPSDLLALILRAELLDRQGQKHKAAAAFAAVATVSPPIAQLHPTLRPAVEKAIAYKARYDQEMGEFIDSQLASRYAALGEASARFRESVDIMLGRKRRYDSQSMLFHFQGLAPVTFFDPGLFPWFADLSAATPVIREEFLAVLASDAGFAPYITYPDDAPLNQWAELNHSPRWSAFHLYKQGERVEANARRCPRTMEILAAMPMPEQAGRTPTAMFSLLKPKTRIPPHVGVSNVRLVAHLPLIVPAQCGFRVGNDVREWIPGKPWVFDDTIEHEAWNESEALRVVLIFDVWHPHLSAGERALVTELASTLNAFTGQVPPPFE
jgi:aspartyl/asparaginyl beta-hydroxylase (cupin superfamily)/Flp pilus assembly protein TadD